MIQIIKIKVSILYGGEIVAGDGFYVLPTIVKAENSYEIVQEETFAPILYIIPYDNLDEAIQLHNGVPQGLSSAIFTTNVLNSETFLSHEGSDCGIANVNIGTSGAEIGGAFGGEKTVSHEMTFPGLENVVKISPEDLEKFKSDVVSAVKSVLEGNQTESPVQKPAGG